MLDQLFPPAPAALPDGPIVVTANHPFGILDAMVLGAVFAKHRPPVRVLGNSLLSRYIASEFSLTTL